MSENQTDRRHRGGDARCDYTWCATRHDSTVHLDDEAHRSAGAGFPARVRAASDAGAGIEVDVEVGILRRPTDEQTWFVIEAGAVGFALSLDGARELRRVLVEDPQIGAALAS